ncbi:peptidase S41 [Brevundimonas sp. S30B]|uniref:S41 family peptidase n=1 Tax=unclassified Brevundimonas TaxID=2622653 RepID=UPI0010724350|nr:MULTISPECIES: S41 family peptidase [unclassified Brevundimonas]QBX38209.1 peptidase S41 [Brevundimonas sp. MF30-B]TFW01654.1 peptidase S41 [Brevundimonas sp. S30B]
MRTWISFRPLIPVLAALVFAGIGPAAPAQTLETAAAALTAERARMNQRVFDRVWNEVRRSYYDPGLHGVDWRAARTTYRPLALAAPDDRRLYEVIGDMLDQLDDDHAGVLPPAGVARADRFASRAVMGVTIGRDHEDGRTIYRIERVRPGSPAEAAGVKLGWRLNAVDGRPWGADVRIEEGRTVRLDLSDEFGQPHHVELTPRTMAAPPLYVADRSRPGTVVFRIAAFEAGLGEWMGKELALTPPGADVILDLRGNPGGLLMEADAVLSCFLPRHHEWAVRTGRSGRAVVLRTVGGCGDRTETAQHQVAVLVDDTSRSAAELTPAALQEAGRALVIGSRTAGAVLISQDTPLPDGGRLTLSRADFVTTGGVRLEKRGVVPDIEINLSWPDRRQGPDAVLEAAVGALETMRAATIAERAF